MQKIVNGVLMDMTPAEIAERRATPPRPPAVPDRAPPADVVGALVSALAAAGVVTPAQVALIRADALDRLKR